MQALTLAALLSCSEVTDPSFYSLGLDLVGKLSSLNPRSNHTHGNHQ